MILYLPLLKATQLGLFNRKQLPTRQVLVHEKSGKTHMQSYHVNENEEPERMLSRKLKMEYKVDAKKVWDSEMKDTYESSNYAALCIRELIQNSVDAVRSKKRKGIKPKVIVNVSEDAIEVIDNGSGMSLEKIKNIFLKFKGSEKEEGSLGGFGVAKALILGTSSTGEWEIQSGKYRVWNEDIGKSRSKEDFINIQSHYISQYNQSEEDPAFTNVDGTRFIIFNPSPTVNKDYYYKEFNEIMRQMKDLSVSGVEFECSLGFHTIEGSSMYDSSVNEYVNKPKLTKFTPLQTIYKSDGNKQPDTVKNEHFSNLNWGENNSVTVSVSNGYFEETRSRWDLKEDSAYICIRSNGIPQSYRYVEGLDKRVYVDIKSTNTPDDWGYPFTKSRESLRGDAADALNKMISELTVDRRSKLEEAEKIVAKDQHIKISDSVMKKIPDDLNFASILKSQLYGNEDDSLIDYCKSEDGQKEYLLFKHINHVIGKKLNKAIETIATNQEGRVGDCSGYGSSFTIRYVPLEMPRSSYNIKNRTEAEIKTFMRDMISLSTHELTHTAIGPHNEDFSVYHENVVNKIANEVYPEIERLVDALWKKQESTSTPVRQSRQVEMSFINDMDSFVSKTKRGIRSNRVRRAKPSIRQTNLFMEKW